MTMVREIMRISPCNTGLVSQVLCDVTLDDDTTHRVLIKRDPIGDWRLDRTYRPRELHVTLLDAAGSLANEIEAQQKQHADQFVASRRNAQIVWDGVPGGYVIRSVECDVKSKRHSFRVRAFCDNEDLRFEPAFIDRSLQQCLLGAVRNFVSELEARLSNLGSKASPSKSLRSGGPFRPTPCTR